MRELFGAKNLFWLAPMAGITDSAFRSVCAGFGAGLTYTEMISAKALVYKDKKTRELLRIENDHRPCFVQIFGADPRFCGEGAALALALSGADGVDINMGCPVGKIVSNGEGSALIKSPSLAAEIVKSVKQAAGGKPVTVKTRIGFGGGEDYITFAKALESAGADAVCIHGRTREQMYTGRADWQAIRAVKQALCIPVFASGDIFSAQDARAALETTGCDAVMIARGALGKPWVFESCLREARGQAAPEVDTAFILDTMLAHIRLMCDRQGEGRAMPQARKHALWYLANLRGARPYKADAAQVKTYEELRTLCDRIISDRLKVKA